MNALISRLYLAALTAALVAGCQTPQPGAGAAASNPEPKILSVTRQNGKGIPYGRTDSAAPYLRVIKLQTATDLGYSVAKAIKTGPNDNRLHLLYLNSLRGPKGEPVTYERRGACCEFEDKSIPTGGGLLDVYDIQVDGDSKTITIYVDMYRKGPPLLPVGFTRRPFGG